MIKNNVIRKVGSYLGILSIVSSNVAFSMQSPKKGTIEISGQNVTMRRTVSREERSTNINELTYKDFDLTELKNGTLHTSCSSGYEQTLKRMGLNTNIPYIGGRNPNFDKETLAATPFIIAEQLSQRLHIIRPKSFFEQVAKNNAEIGTKAEFIPDKNCLYYKDVKGKQHLFLRISTETMKYGAYIQGQSDRHDIWTEDGDICINAKNAANFEGVSIKGDNISVTADKLLTRATKLHAKWVIDLNAKDQQHYTVINKWVKEDKGKNHFVHAEGISSVDDGEFIAEKVIQEGENISNYGIFVDANEFVDRSRHTINMPAKITLINYAWEKCKGFLSSASSSVKRTDDVLIPTRYHVNYYKSSSDKEGSSVKYGYTIINAGSKIEVTKDIKEDVLVDEQHTIEIHEKKSGFSIFGGVKVPNPMERLDQVREACQNNNMVGFTTSMIGATAKAIQMYNDYEVLGKLSKIKGGWDQQNVYDLCRVMSHFVNGLSVQFGTQTMDMRQSSTISHVNTVIAPEQVYHNKNYSSFAGRYEGKNIDIKTGTLVTLALPQTTESQMSVRQAGISMDLLSFAITLMNPSIASAFDAALVSSSVNVSCEGTKSKQTIYHPTTIRASKHLNIEADNGYLTQAQIKAGIIHAIFTKDLVLKTLANESWKEKRGGGFSLSFGALQEALEGQVSDQIKNQSFGDRAGNLLGSVTVSSTDAKKFEKKIDEFASLVGEKDFYMKVGGVLRTESAFLGHITHDQSHEHIEAKEWQDVQVEEIYRSRDNSFSLSFGDLRAVFSAIKNQIFEEAIAEGLSPEEAESEVEETQDDVEKFLRQANVQQAIQELKKTKEELKKVKEKKKEQKGKDQGSKADLQKKEEELIKNGLFATQRMYELTENYGDKESWSKELKESVQQGVEKLYGFVSDITDKITGEKAEAMSTVVTRLGALAKITLKAGAKSKARKKFINLLIKISNQELSPQAIEKELTRLDVDLEKGNASEHITRQWVEEPKGKEEEEGLWTRAVDWVQSSTLYKKIFGKKASTSTPIRSSINSSGGSVLPPDPEKEPKKDKKITRENWRSLEVSEQRKIRDNFFEDKVKNGDWNKPEHTIGGRKAWQNADHKNIYYTRDNRHNDIEAWQVSGHRAEHLGSMEPVEGTMYKGPNHPPARFE